MEPIEGRCDRMIDLLRRLAFGVAWLAIVVVLAFGSAGIVAGMDHPAGTGARPELTWAGDRAIQPGLQAASATLTTIDANVDQLGVLGRAALVAMSGRDAATLQTIVDEGAALTVTISADTATLRAMVDRLPAATPETELRTDGALLAGREAILGALPTTSGLAASWAQLTSGSLAAIALMTLLVDHDSTVAAAAAQGRTAQYPAALALLTTATGMLDRAVQLRDRLANTTDVSLLDQWIARNQAYDAALTKLYRDLEASGGKVNTAVRADYAAEQAARSHLPPDTRGLVVIMAEIGQGGINQAVIAIQTAKDQLDAALGTIEATIPSSGASPPP